jgi:hypothetical protein
MADTHVITALVKRRAELAGQIEAAHEGPRKMIADLETMDLAILPRPTHPRELPNQPGNLASSIVRRRKTRQQSSHGMMVKSGQ